MRPKKEPVDFDGAWKAATYWLLQPMLQLIAPSLYEEIDWSVPAVFLEQELPRLRGFGRRGKRTVDRLIRLKLKNGKLCDLLLHIEVQGRSQKKFASRMLGYYLHLVDAHGEEVQLVQIAILCDLQAEWRPSGLTKSCHGTLLDYRYHMVKLLDLEPDLDRLIASGNPFALVVAAQIKAARTKRKLKERAHWKGEYLLLAKQMGRSEDEIGTVIAFIDHVLQVSPALDNEIKRRQNESGKEGNMFHTSGGIVGDARGQAYVEGQLKGELTGEIKGELKTLISVLLDLAREKFGDVPEQIAHRVQEATPETLRTWTRNIIKRDRLEDVFC